MLIPASDSSSSETHTADRSQDMCGWFHPTHANRAPSGDGRGAATKPPASTRVTTRRDPSVATATTRWPVPEWS